MAEVNTELLKESRIREARPSGFDTLLEDSDRLRLLENADLGLLDNTIEDYGNNEISERDIIEYEIQRILTSFVTPERTIELPGLGLMYNEDYIKSFAAEYKDNSDTPSGSIKSEKRAGPDDIVFTFASPEVYTEVSGTAASDFMQTGLTAGNTLDVIGDGGIDDATNASDASMTLDDDEMMFFTGDFVDLNGGQSAVSKFEWVDVDGEDYGPDSVLFDGRLSGAHVATAQGSWVKSTVDLDAKIYADGDAEIVPVAFYMGPGTKAPALV